MNPDQLALWQRIQAYGLDDPKSARPFSLRLAVENGWKPHYTQRVIEEYRRFVFLAVVAGHPVSPPDAVDQVWHLHLLYTRDYWGEFCPKVLGMPLHHGPARGGVGESDKFADWYARTRESYRRFFGEPSPEFWPECAGHPHAVRVDVARNWVVPKPRWLGGAWAATARVARRLSGGGEEQPSPAVESVDSAKSAGVGRAVQPSAGVLAGAEPRGAASVAFVPLAAAGWPFNLPGPEFLVFYVVFAAGCIAVALWWRQRSRSPHDDGEDVGELSAYDIAHLVGGPHRVFVAGLAALVQRGLIDVRKDSIARTATPMQDDLPLVERAICCATRIDGEKARRVRAGAVTALEATKSALIERRLILNPFDVAMGAILPAAVAAISTIVGMKKILIGQDLGRPIIGLILLTIVTACVVVGLLVKPPRITGRGRAVLARMRAKHEGVSRLPAAALSSPEGGALVPLSVGLFGVAVLAGTPLDSVAKHIPARSEGASGGGGCGSACSSGSGGGDGGGGGCGGCGGGGGD